MVYRSISLRTSYKEIKHSRIVDLTKHVDGDVLENLYQESEHIESFKDSGVSPYVLVPDSFGSSKRMSDRYRINFQDRSRVLINEMSYTNSKPWTFISVPGKHNADQQKTSLMSHDNPLRLYINMTRRNLISCEFSHFVDIWEKLTEPMHKTLDISEFKMLEDIVTLENIDSNVVEEVLESQYFPNHAMRKLFDLTMQKVITYYRPPLEFAIAA